MSILWLFEVERMKLMSYNVKGMRKKRRFRGNLLLPILAIILAIAAIGAGYEIFMRDGGTIKTTANANHSSITSTSKSGNSSVDASSTKSSSTSQTSASQKSTSSAAVVASSGYFKNAVFAGDSLTEGIDIYDVMDDATVVANTGLSTYLALKSPIKVNDSSMMFVDAIKAAKPTKVYILLGSNDIIWMTEDSYISDYGKLLDSIKSGCPNAKIYVQSIFPVTAAYEKKVTNAKIDEYNSALMTLTSQKGLTYLNVASVLKGSDGKLPDNASDDGVHLKKAYYDKWFDYIASNT
jgi:lysophospholipase L1-like esterase